MKRFLNKKALVTGGASGIGKAICQRLVEEGADLVFIDRNIEAGKAFEQELSNQESSSLFVAADLTNEDEVERGFHETKKILGHIDVLINNAGGAFGENYKETTIENWNADLTLNLTSHYMLTRLVLPEMVERGQGVVTNISSVNGGGLDLGQTVWRFFLPLSPRPSRHPLPPSIGRACPTSPPRSAVASIEHNLSQLPNFEIFCKILQIFGGLVLGCIKTKFCKKICVRQHFSPLKTHGLAWHTKHEWRQCF